MEEKLPEKLLKPYDPKNTESRIYKLWEDSGFFNPDVCIEKGVTSADAETFSIVLPPPNATGVLHLGHALEDSMQDTMIRYNRMKGKQTLWIPGTDHAAIATDAKVTKILEKEGLKKKEIGREKFLERVDAFVADSRKTIVSQLRNMGASLDWSREAFTLDETRNQAVKIAFKKMYDDGLIYRGSKVINWDPKGQTTISDDEIVYVERKSKLYTFKYGKNFPISISTTRPETKVGDVAVAVHPEDTRYAQFVGKEYDEVFCGVPIHIKIIADESVEKDFGTGALGVTPAHSMIDAEIAERHKLPYKPVINEFAKMTVGGENILNKKTTEAREVVVEWLKAEGLLEKEEEVNQNISTAERTGGIIEPLPKLQWFVDVNKKIPSRDNKSLKELMLEPVRDGKIHPGQKGGIKILPEHFEKVYFNWIENLRDWCISRQIWYGHRIPVWYKGNEIFVGTEAPGNDPAQNGDGASWTQDEDTLDTWFSSGLWTFSTLGWPNLEASDFKKFHPTNVINPGYEILFFWVARMILMSQYLVGEIPFKTVYLHGMLRDAKGQKFSKSLDNGIDPIQVINEFGADALRMALIVGIGPGADAKFDLQKVKAYGKFSNKIWNITRYVLGMERVGEMKKELVDEWEALALDVKSDMDNYRFYLGAEKLYAYIWHRFADEIIEESKNKPEYGNTLYYLLENFIKLLHPFMPFVTEEIWSLLPTENKKLLMVEKL